MKTKHLNPITVARASDDDAFVAIFIQIWATVFTSILTAGLSQKD